MSRLPVTRLEKSPRRMAGPCRQRSPLGAAPGTPCLSIIQHRQGACTQGITVVSRRIEGKGARKTPAPILKDRRSPRRNLQFMPAPKSGYLALPLSTSKCKTSKAVREQPVDYPLLVWWPSDRLVSNTLIHRGLSCIERRQRLTHHQAARWHSGG